MKKRLLCPNLPTPHHPVLLEETEAHHAIRVLRLRDGDSVEAMDGKGKKVIALLRTQGGQPRLEHLNEGAFDQNPLPGDSAALRLTLEMSVLKSGSMEWVIEKAVELGVQTFIPILTAHTVVQMKQKSPAIFQQRWQKIADQALKQCGRLERMEIELPILLEQLLQKTQNEKESLRLWCDEAARNTPEQTPSLTQWIKSSQNSLKDKIRVLIGPEGGWSSEERHFLCKNAESPGLRSFRVHLGPHILRAETAALFSISLISAHLREVYLIFQ